MTSVVLRPRPGRQPAAGNGPRRDVVLVGFQDQANLGMGYLAAVLEEHGYSVDLLEFRDGPDRIVDHVIAAQPLVVGFSLIFQYFLPDYVQLAQRLRAAGVEAHLSIGGHFPSLCPDEVLDAMPQLDSVGIFEGEMTLLELVTCLASGADWHDVAGLAYRREGATVETAPRPLVHDLDTLPYPRREGEPHEVLGWRYAPVLASRGCARRCSFCSIHVFYRQATGKVVRTRSPAGVVNELRTLADDAGVSIFLFLDDDFPLWGRVGKVWVEELAGEMERTGLAAQAIWKISCRAEYVEPALFARLRDAGLYLVYMGLESGTDEGLDVLNKKIAVEQNLAAVRTLKQLDVAFAYGFMLFDPSSTFESVHGNIGFLREIVGDGSAAATFCRMLPYGGTPIREQLRAEGRLRGDVTRPDYDFLDPRLDGYHRLLDAAVSPWVHGDGVSHLLDCAWHEVHVVRRLVGELPGIGAYREALTALTAESNTTLFDYVEETADAFERGDTRLLDPGVTRPLCDRFHTRLLDLRDRFVAANQDALLAAVDARDELRGPVLLPQIF